LRLINPLDPHSWGKIREIWGHPRPPAGGLLLHLRTTCGTGEPKLARDTQMWSAVSEAKAVVIVPGPVFQPPSPQIMGIEKRAFWGPPQAPGSILRLFDVERIPSPLEGGEGEG